MGSCIPVDSYQASLLTKFNTKMQVPPPTHHLKKISYRHQSLHPLPLTSVWPLLPNEGGGVHYIGDC